MYQSRFHHIEVEHLLQNAELLAASELQKAKPVIMSPHNVVILLRRF